MTYYDDEALLYDETRGGWPRAEAVAGAVAELVPGRGVAVDAAGGTGIVSAQLARLGFRVVVADLSLGMLSVASSRLPGRVVAARAERMPVRSGSVDLVCVVWLLHLLPIPSADRVVAEACRILRPGGSLVTTVDKDLAHGAPRRTNGDHGERVVEAGRRVGLRFSGQSSFTARTRWPSAGPEHEQVFPVMALRKPG